jgi:DUF1009 family protein
MEKIGLLAGVGRLPVECAKAAQKIGYEVYAVALLPDCDPELKNCTKECVDISIAQIDKILSYLKEKELHKVTMLGKVTKELLFSGSVQPDAHALQLIMSLPDRKDDTIMLAFVRELAKAGLQAFDQTALLRMLMPHRGTITKLEPTAEQKKDMEYAFRMAKEIGRLDIGQTCVVKDMAVMALEAIEGTDACIKRGGALARGGAVVAKVAKPQQDSRFDVPAVGLKTLETMAEAGCAALGIEADKTLLIDRERVAAFADAHGITIVAL